MSHAATEQPLGTLETVATFDGPMPTGVTVSHSGRIFVNFPKWGDAVTATVVEIRDGKCVPFPDQASNSPSSDHDAGAFVSVDALVDRSLEDAAVAGSVVDEGDKGSASDGLETDDADRLYATAYEHNTILRMLPGGEWETVVHDPRLLFPDTRSVATDRYLYVTANQLHRQAAYQRGKDLRERPYHVFRTPIDAGPVLLRPAAGG